MAEDERATLAALTAHRTEVFAPLIERHDGRIVKLIGDGALAEFSSVAEAVASATAIQTAIAEDPESWLKLRIGIHLGDVIPDGDDIYGGGVNVAARLESMADARVRIEEWRCDYNQNRPHSALGGLMPAEFADQLKPARKVA